jgi:hypothetical protein
MQKYLFSYAVGGCLGAIATASLLTELARLVPAIRLGLGFIWALAAIVSAIALKGWGLDQVYGRFWVLGHGVIALGVCFGLI